MLRFSLPMGRPPKYRSARAIPSESAASPSRISVVRAIQLLMGGAAITMLFTSLVHLYPMFHAVDSTMMAHIENIPPMRAVASDADARTLPGGEIHGVQKNMIEHRQMLRDHWEKMTANYVPTTKVEERPRNRVEQQHREVAQRNTSTGDSSAAHRKRVEGAATAANPATVAPAKTKARVEGAATAAKPAKAVTPAKTKAEGGGKKQDSPNGDKQAPALRADGERGLARGFSGLPMAQTPALIGAKRGTVDCDVDVDALAYWNSPQGRRDEEFVSPFRGAAAPATEQYLTFEPDTGGFNNIRMSVENIFVIAAATGRTLVLPPPQNIYLLNNAHTQSYEQFFPIYTEAFQKRVKVITSGELLTLEMVKGGALDVGDRAKATTPSLARLLRISQGCTTIKADSNSCFALYEFLRTKGVVAPFKDSKHCLIFNEKAFKQGPSAVTAPTTKSNIKRFCQGREPVYYGSDMAKAPVLHFRTGEADDYRLLNHFYSAIYFTDPVVDNYYRRFIRDFIHYRDSIFCSAGKIVRLLQAESRQRGFEADEEGAGGYSALHVRRGDLQFKEVIISAEEWYNNTAKLWRKKELLYIATDEINKKFFAPIAKHHDLRFLGDYYEKAGLEKLDPKYLGMVEIVVASRGRLFVGTWHSSFSGYIMRLRGYYGVSKMSNYYSFRPRRFIMHKWMYPSGNFAAREFQSAWLGIDGDKPVLGDLESDSPSPIGPSANISLLGKPFPRPTPLARGFSGLPMSQSPALVGASRGKIACDVNVDSLAYWNDPQGSRDRDFVSPFRPSPTADKKQYITFWQDAGRFNNLRMSLEIVMVYAAATGRTIVLPPTQNMLLEEGHSTVTSFEQFYSFQSDEFKKRVPVISMKEFIKEEGGQGGLATLNGKDYTRALDLANKCENRRRSEIYCGEIYAKIASHSNTLVAPVGTGGGMNSCLVFDEDAFKNGPGRISPEVKKSCGNRHIVFYTHELSDVSIIHFDSFEKEHRLLTHFYLFIHFTNPLIDNYFKRFVRDFLHYNDRIFCAAGKIVRSIQQEATELGFSLDEEGGGGYSSLHVRRNDLQYKDVWISDDKWWENTKELWKPREILFIATDEKDNKFFDNFALDHDLRFLEDYSDMANLGSFAKEHLGMMDAIVASRGRQFVGTYYSTFSGYITRMRGYYGMSKSNSWYAWKEVKFEMQKGVFLSPSNEFRREYPIGWVAIDGDERVTRESEDKKHSEEKPVKNGSNILSKPAVKEKLAKTLDVNHDNNSPAHGIRSSKESTTNVFGFESSEDKNLEVADDGTTIYTVFSTDCKPSQNWESYLLFFSAMQVRQAGFITRIASGCTEKQKQAVKTWHLAHVAVMSNRFKLFFTPKFSNINREDYKYFNKPFGVKYYLENCSDFGWDKELGKMTTVADEAVVIIIDPDMILLQPLTTDFSDSSVKFWSPHRKAIERKKKVGPLTPFGQTYGFSHKWMQFIELAGPESLALKVDETTADLHYQVGPPYISTVLDMHKIVRRWAELVPEVYKAKPQLLSEMYAYCLAAADRGLPHEVVDSMMISAPGAYGEGWDMIDRIPDEEICLTGRRPNQSMHPLPTVLHYCQYYGTWDVLFSKYLMPDDIFTCSKPLLIEPDDNAMSPDNAYRKGVNGKKIELKPKFHKRNVFATCTMTSMVNEASLFFKLHHCNGSHANKERKLNLLA